METKTASKMGIVEFFALKSEILIEYLAVRKRLKVASGVAQEILPFSELSNWRTKISQVSDWSVDNAGQAY